MINTGGDVVGKGKIANFKGKKAAPFKKGGGRKKTSVNNHKGLKRK
jgi:hypothetical protein